MNGLKIFENPSPPTPPPTPPPPLPPPPPPTPPPPPLPPPPTPPPPPRAVALAPRGCRATLRWPRSRAGRPGPAPSNPSLYRKRYYRFLERLVQPRRAVTA